MKQTPKTITLDWNKPLGTPRTRALQSRVLRRARKAQSGQRRGLASRFRHDPVAFWGSRDRALAGKKRIRARKAARTA